ncbi:hypothetical protein ACFOGJ_21705 [Marinibaculum pumilum]|uniref:Uncharacterized protein n=1 Tax=Marinibaculum pumilum TaxID=1766165 RepID=A0ABV7L649_9PROT
MAKRPRQVPQREPLTTAQIEQAIYVGSPEHKKERWWGGLPEAYVGPDGDASRPGRQITSVCELTTEAERDEATNWVRTALRMGQFRYRDADKDFPAHIWYRDEAGQLWQGRCVNSVLGTYKGWPVDEAERSEDIR